MKASAGVLVAVALGAAGVVSGACSSSPGASAASGEDSGVDAGAPAPQPNDAGDGAVDDGGDGSAEDATPTPPQTFLRIAHVSPDSPSFDVCAAPHGTSVFQGPLLGALAASLATGGGDGGEEVDGGAVGIAYSQVSAYLALAPGRYDVRFVPAGATSCDSTLELASSDWTNLPVLALSTYSTLLVAGELSPAEGDAPLGVTVLPDDAVLAGGAAILRAVNAVPSETSLDLGLGSAAAWVPLLTDVSFGAASGEAAPSETAIDANGYLPIAPIATGTLSARPSGSDAGADTAVANDVEIDLGSIATVIAIGGKTGDPAHPPALLLCMDNQPAGGLFSDCSVGQPFLKTQTH